MSADRPPLGAKAPLGGSRSEASSVGVTYMSADRPPLGAKATSGGSAEEKLRAWGLIT